MTDETLRALERRFRETGDVADEGAWLAARVRAGEVLAGRVEVAALCGHEGAVASGVRTPATLAECAAVLGVTVARVRQFVLAEWALLAGRGKCACTAGFKENAPATVERLWREKKLELLEQHEEFSWFHMMSEIVSTTYRCVACRMVWRANDESVWPLRRG